MTEGYHRHSFSAYNRKVAFAFIDRFNDMPIRYELDPIDSLGVKELRCTESGQVLREFGGRNITVTPREVLIEMEISKRVIRTLANNPPTILQDDESMEVEYAPPSASLTIEGPEDLIRGIVAEDVSIILNITTKQPGTYRLQPEIIVPQSIEKYWLDVDAFEITILAPQVGDNEEE